MTQLVTSALSYSNRFSNSVGESKKKWNSSQPSLTAIFFMTYSCKTFDMASRKVATVHPSCNNRFFLTHQYAFIEKKDLKLVYVLVVLWTSVPTVRTNILTLAFNPDPHYEKLHFLWKTLDLGKHSGLSTPQWKKWTSQWELTLLNLSPDFSPSHEKKWKKWTFLGEARVPSMNVSFIQSAVSKFARITVGIRLESGEIDFWIT